MQLLEGYFVHFAAPDNLVPMPKHVVFVLDTSGSMRHRKMHQVRDIAVCNVCDVTCTVQTVSAMMTILGEMRPEDHFTIISFATNVSVGNIHSNTKTFPVNLQKYERL